MSGNNVVNIVEISNVVTGASGGGLDIGTLMRNLTNIQKIGELFQ